jgi:hypothetical protein
MLGLPLAGAASGCEDGSGSQAAAASRTVSVSADEEAREQDPEQTEKPSGPPKRIFAKRFVSKIRRRPSRQAKRIGYMRGGAVLRATTARPVGREGCPAGWFELKTGGYVCNGRHVTAFEGERLPAVRATPPDREAKLPYKYGFIRHDRTPMYNRLPKKKEALEHEAYLWGAKRKQRKQRRDKAKRSRSGEDAEAKAKQAAAEKQGLDGGTGRKRTVSDGGRGAATDSEPAGRTGAGRDGGRAAAQRSGEAQGAEDAGLDAGPPTLDGLTEQGDGLVRRWLMRGFYVSLDRTYDASPRRKYWRTYQNGFVPYRSVLEVEGSDFQGVELDGEDWSLPLGFAISGRARRYRKVGERGFRRARKQLQYHDVFPIVGQQERRGRTFYEGPDGFLYRDSDYITRVRARERPDRIGPDEKWIDVNLTAQALVAYEGDEPVYATLISSGRIKDEDDPEQNHATPKGIFRVRAKHLTHKMDGDNAIDGPYSIDDVPYVMYFQLAYALHSAFWHRLFGRPKSHGCINMAPLDARWVFEWSSPELPHRWHGVYPTEKNKGTWIVIHGETPKG